MENLVFKPANYPQRVSFTLDKYWFKIRFENYVFCYSSYRKWKKLFEVFLSVNHFAYSCSVTIHTSYTYGMRDQKGGVKDIKMLKDKL